MAAGFFRLHNSTIGEANPISIHSLLITHYGTYICGELGVQRAQIASARVDLWARYNRASWNGILTFNFALSLFHRHQLVRDTTYQTLFSLQMEGTSRWNTRPRQ